MLSTVDCTRTETHRKGYFAQIPDALGEDPRLKTRDVTTVMAILRFARSKSWASMGNATLASMGRCTVRTIQLSLGRLEAAGWIRRVETDAEIGSATKRLVYLVWRESATNFTPQAPAIAPPPVKPISPEPDSHPEPEKPAVMGPWGPRPAEPQKPSLPPRPAKPQGMAPARPVASRSACPPRYPTHRAAEPLPLDPGLFSAWLARPVGDALRSMAERTLERTLNAKAVSHGT